MKNSVFNFRFGLLSLIVLFAAISRLIPHPPNFTPIGAIALFGGAYFSQKSFSFIIPVIAMWLSDLIINNIIYAQYFDGFVWFYQGFYWSYGALIFTVVIGITLLKKVKLSTLLLSGLLTSIIFFLISNFGVWMSGKMYTNDFIGLTECYIAGLPFFRNTLTSNLIYIGLMFGVFNLAQRKYKNLQQQHI